MKIKGPVGRGKPLLSVAEPGAKRPPVCGDSGGFNENGRPCQIRSKGRCPQHDDARQVAMQAVKKEVLERLGKGEYIIQIAKAVNISPVQLWRWRKQDVDFDNAVANAAMENDDARTKLVEESMFHRIVTGTAQAAETIFWLKNRAPDRWKDRHETVLTGTLEHRHILARMLGVDPSIVPGPQRQIESEPES